MENRYSLLIVDDEKIARESILKALDWKKLGIDTLYEAEDGFVAERMIREKKPDIMLLDIRMPQMNGVQLMARIADVTEDMQVVILSAYSDFEVARTLLTSDSVQGYLLKPVAEDELTEMVIKCTDKIEQLQIQKKNRQNYNEMITWLHRRAVADLIFDREKDSVFDRLPGNSTSMQVGVLYMPEAPENPEEVLMAHQDLEPLKYCYRTENPQFCALYFESDQQIGRVAHVCQKLKDMGYDHIGLGGVYQDWQDISMSYQQALIACEISLLSGDLNRVKKADADESLTQDWDSYVVTLRNALNAADTGTLESTLLEVFYSTLHKKASQFSSERKQNLAVLKARAAKLLEATLDERRNNLNLTGLYLADDPYSVYLVCREILNQQVTEQRSFNGYRSALIEKVKSYIAENYTEHITLDTVAAYVFVSPSYLSRCFSESVGCVFTDYVTNLRINKAKLLLSTQLHMKIYEVAEASGYNSPKYFIKVFKEKTGQTPAEYRAKHYFDEKF